MMHLTKKEYGEWQRLKQDNQQLLSDKARLFSEVEKLKKQVNDKQAEIERLSRE